MGEPSVGKGLASPAAILNILVKANQDQARAALHRTDEQLKRTPLRLRGEEPAEWIARASKDKPRG